MGFQGLFYSNFTFSNFIFCDFPQCIQTNVYTGRFIRFSVIVYIYNKKTKGPTLIELFTATRKLKKFLFLTTRDVRCVHHRWHGTHRYDIQVLTTHASTWVHRYSSLLQWSVAIGRRGFVGGSFAYFARNARCTANTYLLVWYSNTQNGFSPGAAIFSLRTLASPSGRNVHYDEKKLTGEKFFLSCSFYLYRFRKYVFHGFPIINFCNLGLHYGTPCIVTWSRLCLFLSKS